MLFGDLKAIRRAPSRAIELYDLASDPGETRDLSKERPDLVARAREAFRASRTDEATWPLREEGERIPF